MDRYIIGFTITSEDSRQSVRAYYVGLSEGIDMTGKPEIALRLNKQEAGKIADWLRNQQLPGMSDVRVEPAR